MTPLGLLNFLLLQWFGVRLCCSFDEELIAVDVIRPGRWWSRYAPPRYVPVSWSLLRWLWPLTGWWSDYRWIARPAPTDQLAAIALATLVAGSGLGLALLCAGGAP